MLKCASVYTCEIDDPDVALSQIKTQLEQKVTLLKHSIGIVMCHPEFIATGVLRHICENLPFDLAGVTTSSQAVNDGIGELLLTIFVMTSDDVLFKTGITEEMGSDVDGAVKAAYDRVTAVGTVEIRESPKLALIFPPFGRHAGDEYVRAWEKVIPRVPLFGTHAIDGTATFKQCETIFNGQNHKAAMPFVLCYGNINPRFMIATFSEENTVVVSKAEITRARGNCVYEINNEAANKFFEKIGIAKFSAFTPIMIDFLKREDHDGTPVIRGFASFTEEGAAIFYGEVDEGSTFAFLKWETDDMLLATQQKVMEINKIPDVNGVLLFPCVVRRAVLFGVNNPLQELVTIKETINPEIPFMTGCAGGEICPTSVRDGVPVNRFHNYSLVILIV